MSTNDLIIALCLIFGGAALLVMVWFTVAIIPIHQRTDYYLEQSRRIQAGLKMRSYRPGLLDRFFTRVGMMEPMDTKCLKPERQAA